MSAEHPPLGPDATAAEAAPAAAEPVGEEAARPARAARSADLAWAVVRRIHLGTRRPANWLQLFQFGVVGGSGYVLNLAVFAALIHAADVQHQLAAVGAFVVAVTNNFVLNRLWTFQAQGARDDHAGFQAARFFAVSLCGLMVNLVVLTALVDLAGIARLPSQAIAVAIATPVNFVGNKLWTFRRVAELDPS